MCLMDHVDFILAAYKKYLYSAKDLTLLHYWFLVALETKLKLYLTI